MNDEKLADEYIDGLQEIINSLERKIENKDMKIDRQARYIEVLKKENRMHRFKEWRWWHF